MAANSSRSGAQFRFYAALNDFLRPTQIGRWIPYAFENLPGIKDPIEALGVPHTEVELIVVNGSSVDFSYKLHDGDKVAVYPPFFQVDISPLMPLREPLLDPAFVLDVHLGKLAKLLRLLGMDVLYNNRYHDRELANIAEREGRVLLTRDRRLLFYKRIVYAYFVRHSDPVGQVKEVIERYSLESRFRPFSRCISCNGDVVAVNKRDILDHLEPKTIRYYNEFYRCSRCGQIYWRGSHFKGLINTLEKLVGS